MKNKAKELRKQLRQKKAEQPPEEETAPKEEKKVEIKQEDVEEANIEVKTDIAMNNLLKVKCFGGTLINNTAKPNKLMMALASNSMFRNKVKNNVISEEKERDKNKKDTKKEESKTPEKIEENKAIKPIQKEKEEKDELEALMMGMGGAESKPKEKDPLELFGRNDSSGAKLEAEVSNNIATKPESVVGNKEQDEQDKAQPQQTVSTNINLVSKTESVTVSVGGINVNNNLKESNSNSTPISTTTKFITDTNNTVRTKNNSNKETTAIRTEEKVEKKPETVISKPVENKTNLANLGNTQTKPQPTQNKPQVSIQQKQETQKQEIKEQKNITGNTVLNQQEKPSQIKQEVKQEAVKTTTETKKQLSTESNICGVSNNKPPIQVQQTQEKTVESINNNYKPQSTKTEPQKQIKQETPIKPVPALQQLKPDKKTEQPQFKLDPKKQADFMGKVGISERDLGAFNGFGDLNALESQLNQLSKNIDNQFGKGKCEGIKPPSSSYISNKPQATNSKSSMTSKSNGSNIISYKREKIFKRPVTKVYKIINKLM